MKMFLVVYENYLDESTTDTFREAGFKAYTKIHDVTGEGENTGRGWAIVIKGPAGTTRFHSPLPIRKFRSWWRWCRG